VTKVPKDQGFGIWYLAEDVASTFNESLPVHAESWEAGMQAQGMTLLGSKAKFNGFGVVFTTAARDGSRKPQVGFIKGDGSSEVSLDSDVSASCNKIDFRNTEHPAQVKIQVKDSQIDVRVRKSVRSAWQPCFKATIRAPLGGHIGITGWTGTPGPELKADAVSIPKLEMMNFDESRHGEDIFDLDHKGDDMFSKMQSELEAATSLLGEDLHTEDQGQQATHLGSLEHMLQTYIDMEKTAEQRMSRQIDGLTKRLSKLNVECRNLKQEVHVFVAKGKEGPAGGVHELRKQLIGLRRVLTKDSEHHRHKMDKVHSQVGEIESRYGKSQPVLGFGALDRQTDELARTNSSRARNNFVAMFGMFACALVLGIQMYRRMSYYEKKHFI